jgi:transcriptional regulator with XRE-family HTH domain
MNSLNKVIGIALRKARLQRGYTQQNVANSGIVSREHLVNIEHGRYNPSTELLTNLLKFYKADFEIRIKLN